MFATTKRLFSDNPLVSKIENVNATGVAVSVPHAKKALNEGNVRLGAKVGLQGRTTDLRSKRVSHSNCELSKKKNKLRTSGRSDS